MLCDWKLRTKYRYLMLNFTHTFMPYAGLEAFYNANKDFKVVCYRLRNLNSKMPR